ncbi:rhodanese-like domain-containing protein [Xanthobacter sp. DSM 24535]|uniref:rhodanese-like domain-containing protein n=1 Tax=Roseixanthobacter psychrophilus TaxID=3119917 RepID=UPI003726FE77
MNQPLLRRLVAGVRQILGITEGGGTPRPTPIDALAAKTEVDEGRAILVDIREPVEVAVERIPGAVLLPLSRITAGTSLGEAGGKATIFLCRSGGRTSLHARRLQQLCPGQAYLLKGGIVAWRAKGLPMAKSRR